MAERPFFAPALAIVVGAGLFGIVDGAIGLLESGLSLNGGSQHAIYFLLCAGQTMLVGIAAGAAIAALLALFPRPRVFDARGGGFSIAVVLIALLAAVLCEIWNRYLFKGAGIHGRSWRPAVEWTFRLLVGPLVFVAILMAIRLLGGARKRSWGTLLLAIGIVLLGANRALRNQYPDVHTQLAVAALAVLSGGVLGWIRGSRLDPARSAATTVIASLLGVAIALASVHAPRVKGLQSAFLPGEAAFATRAFGVAQFEPLIRRINTLTGQPAAPAPEAVDVGALLAEIAPQIASGAPVSPAARRAVEDALDRIAPSRRNWNVLWVALDTVRADHVGHLGYPRRTTPNLDRLAEGAFVFEKAHTSFPTSNYGFSGALTSLAARASPVYGRRFHPSTQYHPQQALPALLAENGRVSAAVTAFDKATLDNPVFFKELKEGFQVFNPDQTESSADASVVTASALKLLGGPLRDGANPFFLWVHYLDAHDPYLRRPGFDFGAESIDRYDSEIAYADHALGELLDGLDRNRLADDTIVVVFSDHGEEFNEHGGRFHNGSVYEEQTHVPLVIKVPGVKGRRVTCPVSLLDLTPTVADLLGIADEAPRHGRSLVPIMWGQDDRGMAYSEVFIERRVPTREVRAVMVDHMKIIHRVQENRFELYDLKRDPHERNSLIGQGNPGEALLRSVLAKWDAAIDAPFSEPERSHFSKKIDGMVAELTRGSPAASSAAASLRDSLVSGYGTLRLDVTDDISEPEVAAVMDRIAAILPETQGDVAACLVWMLGHRRDPRFAPVLRRVMDDVAMPPAARIGAAVGIATLDDPTVLPMLRQALVHRHQIDAPSIATAMIRLGDPTGIVWYQAALDTIRWGADLRDAILALPKLRRLLPHLPGYADATPARSVRNRVAHESGRHHEVDMALVEALAAEEDEDALLVLSRLMRCNDDVVRAAAARELREVLTQDDFDRNIAAMDDEIDADSAFLNLHYDDAVRGYRAALERGTLRNIGLRFRLADALRDSGRIDDARKVLEDIERLAPIALDRALARRRIDQLRFPWKTDPEHFKCTVLDVRPPAVFFHGEGFGMTFRLRNDGSAIWEGGWKAGAVELAIRFLDASGNVVESLADLTFANHLPEAGVNPGEAVDVVVLGVAPRGAERGPLILMFKNQRAAYPDGGVVWREQKTESRSPAAPSLR